MRLLCSIITLPKWDLPADHESPALDVIDLLRHHDLYVPSIHHSGGEMAGEAHLAAGPVTMDCAWRSHKDDGHQSDAAFRSDRTQ